MFTKNKCLFVLLAIIAISASGKEKYPGKQTEPESQQAGEGFCPVGNDRKTEALSDRTRDRDLPQGEKR